MLPANIQHSLEQHFAANIRPIKPIYGGDINHAVQIQIGQQTALLKWRAASQGFFCGRSRWLNMFGSGQCLGCTSGFGPEPKLAGARMV
ncbi:hypothetical protein [Herpetosiphon sp. NSE202]|uniref:hypothetical protein n=1 Tax=Herpetosiphon sp. NSE202 TaxID=3351349 RepID=UPI00363F761A